MSTNTVSAAWEGSCSEVISHPLGKVFPGGIIIQENSSDARLLTSIGDSLRAVYESKQLACFASWNEALGLESCGDGLYRIPKEHLITVCMPWFSPGKAPEERWVSSMRLVRGETFPFGSYDVPRMVGDLSRVYPNTQDFFRATSDTFKIGDNLDPHHAMRLWRAAGKIQNMLLATASTYAKYDPDHWWKWVGNEHNDQKIVEITRVISNKGNGHLPLPYAVSQLATVVLFKDVLNRFVFNEPETKLVAATQMTNSKFVDYFRVLSGTWRELAEQRFTPAVAQTPQRVVHVLPAGREYYTAAQQAMIHEKVCNSLLLAVVNSEAGKK
ncbi:MAG: hypothetical protein ACOCXT_05865 [Candidatus Dojkabacteria bacterium]